MTPSAMPPRAMSISPEIESRLTSLEVKVGDHDSGMLGEIKDIRKSLRAMELRLAALVTTVSFFTHLVNKLMGVGSS